jgi:L-2-hydroxyglutarate oxidase LhgO
MAAASSDVLDVLVIGGGVTGLAAAAEIAAAGRSVAILERHPRPGMETSTHNSGVIHAGLYYPAGSLKALLCVEGAERLYAFCREHTVRADRCGKLVVASSEEQIPALERLKAHAENNGVADLELVGRDDIRRREPHVAGAAALWSPNTGRVEAEGLVRALRRLTAARDAVLLCATALTGRRGNIRRHEGAHRPRNDRRAVRGQRRRTLRRRGVGDAGRRDVPHLSLSW